MFSLSKILRAYSEAVNSSSPLSLVIVYLISFAGLGILLSGAK
jgi:hypothetical protein